MSEQPPAVDPAAAAGDMVPLSHRLLTLSVLRVLLATALIPAALAHDVLTRPEQIVLPLAYVVLAGLAGAALVAQRNRGLAVGVFGLLLCLDGAMLQVALHLLGTGTGVELLLATFLSAACLLASFRTGVKLAFWQSLLIVVDDRGTANGLFEPGAAGPPQQLALRLLMVWVLTFVVCIAAAINERELRRRRYDAEALQSFAAALHQDEHVDDVVARTVGFVRQHLSPDRVLACGLRDGRLQVIPGTGRRPVPEQASEDPAAEWADTRSPLLELADQTGHAPRILTLDRLLEPWLVRILPGARRLVVLPLTGAEDLAPTWVLLEHRGRGSRVERRVLATAGQASATAALALSRARLFEAAHEAARTDGLTGLANRSAFDERLQQLTDQATARALILVDVDRFKAVNDSYGHQVGDEVLAGVAGCLAAAGRPTDLVARYGGEEFAVLLHGAHAQHATELAELLRARVAAAQGPVAVTASFGVAVVAAGGPLPAKHLIAAADRALYAAKSGGRDRVVLADLPTAARSA